MLFSLQAALPYPSGVTCSVVLFSTLLLGRVSAQVNCDTMVAYPIGSVTDVLATGDLNGDGADDVVIATRDVIDSPDNYKLFIFYQGAAGPVAGPVIPYPNIFPGIRTMDVGDVNNDGLEDMVFGYQDRIAIMYQNATHGFSAAQEQSSGPGVDGIAIGDVNQDGLQDIVVSHWNEPTIKVFRQIPGGFMPISYPKPLGSNAALAIGDMNGDGLNDVVFLSGQAQDRGVYIFAQGPVGHLQSYGWYGPPSADSNGMLSAFGIGDLDGDGFNDLVASLGGNVPHAAIALWRQDPITHSMVDPVVLPAYDIPTAVEIADLDCDGRSEIVVAHSGWSAYSIYAPDDQGQYGPFTTYQVLANGSYGAHSLALADMDGDGRKDVLMANWQFGMGWAKNISLPSVWDAQEVIVTTDTVQGPGGQQIHQSMNYVIDTVDWYITSTLVLTTVLEYTRIDTIGIDSTTIRYGTVCGTAVVDTLRTFSPFGSHTVVSWDTLPAEILSVDTLNMSIGSNAALHWTLAPNPTSGLVMLRPSGAPPLHLFYTILDRLGRQVREGSITRWPLELDLTDLAQGHYVLVVADRWNGPLHRSSVVRAGVGR